MAKIANAYHLIKPLTATVHAVDGTSKIQLIDLKNKKEYWVVADSDDVEELYAMLQWTEIKWRQWIKEQSE